MMPHLTTLRWTSYYIVVAGVALSVCAAILAGII